jgi:hypothetical protein
MRVWIVLAIANFALALGLAVIFRSMDMPDASAITLIAVALSAAQAFYYWKIS